MLNLIKACYEAYFNLYNSNNMNPSFYDGFMAAVAVMENEYAKLKKDEQQTEVKDD